MTKSNKRKDILINYTKFMYKDYPLSQTDVWTIMCKYGAKHPEDKQFAKLLDAGVKILSE